MKLSVLIPCYNEKETIIKVINNIFTNYIDDKEVIIINDFSTDGTTDLLNSLNNKNIKIINHAKNLGKGSAIQSGLKIATGDVILIQDADLEYDSKDYKNLISPILNKNADVVYGSRFLGGKEVRIHFFWHYIANKLLTFFCNIFTNLNMSDMETGYKVFKANVIKSLNLKEKGFGFEPEITIKLAKKKLIIFEVPISYYGRNYSEGKKITIIDAFIALYCIVRYSIKD
jgi:glycosyltransferase involved in cell wall biosynthesis